ncbi:MAG: septum formation family protein [Propionibacteriaceae bacterium]|jgi:hypothetical protein
MSTELPDQADKQANRPPVDWAPPPWANRPTDEPPSDPGSIPGWAPPPWTAGPDAPAAWAPPPWSPDAADTRPFWRQIPAVWLEVAGALLLVGAAVGWQFIGFIRTEAPSVRVTATQSADPSRSAPSTVRGDQPHGPLRKAKSVSWDQLKTGDCFNGFADAGGWKDTDVSPIRVDCRSMHEEEVTGTFTLPGGRHYPGDDAVWDASDARCEKYFARYVGIDLYDSDYDYDYLTPWPEDWRHGDHKAICLAYDSEHQETNKISVRNVKQ